MRINLYAGPGAGKSTTAAWLFAELKKRIYSVELVSEYVKSWAITKRKVTDFDQVYLMGKQMQYEYRFLTNGVQNIVTDSPVLLSAFYARAYNSELGIAEHMEGLIMEYERRHPALNIFLDRKDKTYVTEGRYQNHDQAKEIDTIVYDSLVRLGIPFIKLDYAEPEVILRTTQDAIDEEARIAEEKRIAETLQWIDGLEATIPDGTEYYKETFIPIPEGPVNPEGLRILKEGTLIQRSLGTIIEDRFTNEG